MELDHQIDRALHEQERLLLVLSDASMASAWVRRELKKARIREKTQRTGDRRVLFPIALVPFAKLQAWELWDSDLGEDLAEMVRRFYIPDFSGWSDQFVMDRETGRLLEALRAV
jgi:hypothetical protein